MSIDCGDVGGNVILVTYDGDNLWIIIYVGDFFGMLLAVDNVKTRHQQRYGQKNSTMIKENTPLWI